MQDTGQRDRFATGAVRNGDEGKPRPDLIRPFANLREGVWLGQATKKYDERNWEKGIPISRCIASLHRHLNAYQRGRHDEDHMAAVRCNAGFILHYEEMIRRGMLPAELDDMPDYGGDGASDARLDTNTDEGD